MGKRKTICCVLGVISSLIMLTGCTMFSSRQKLNITENKSYQKSQFPKALSQPGSVLDPVGKGWGEASLDGKWKFKQLPFVKNFKNPLDDEGMKKGFFKSEFNDSDWNTRLVPWSWYHSEPEPGSQVEKDYVIGKLGWYRRSFNIGENQIKDGKRVLLDFRGVADETDVWINGQKAGKRHRGRFDSFQYDVTAFVKAGKNTVAARVYDYVGHTTYKRRHIGGIYEPVRLLTTPSSIYTNRMMLTTLFDKQAVDIQAEIVNATKKTLELKLTAEIADWDGGGLVAVKNLPEFRLAPGRKWTELGEIKIPTPVCWSPENPHLYTLTLRDPKGNAVGMERFGFREFKAEGEWLYLNGKKFKPRMYTFGELSKRIALLRNQNSEMEKILRVFKSLGVNMLRPHSICGPLPETFFNLCDEIGMLVYFDWSGPNYHKAFDKAWKKSIPEMWPSFNKFIRDRYSHPSICMWSLGNEIYEGHYNLWYSDDLDKLYGQVKKLDKQNRPICASTGRQTKGSIRSGILKERVDVLDDHQYRGSYCGSWQENIKHINDYAKIADERYKSKKPKVNAEYGVPSDNVRYRDFTFKKIWPVFQLDPSTSEFKNQYISFLQSDNPAKGAWMRLKINYCSPREYLDEETIRRRLATHQFKRQVEIYRRAGAKCLGGHTNTQWYDVVRVGKWRNTLSYHGKPGPIPQEEVWFDMPLRGALKRLYNPTLVSAGIFNEHPIPGSKQEVEVYVTNDLNEAADFRVVAQLRLGEPEAERITSIEFGEIKAMEQKSKRIAFITPEVEGRKRGQLEFFLFKNGERAGDNYYPVTIVDNSQKVAASEKVALYDVAGRLFRGLGADSSSLVLKELGFKAEMIDDFAKLDQYKFLIIGTNSFDKKLIDSSEKIYEWLKKGGKLLCFEQSLCGKVPFFPNYSVTAGTPSTYVSLSVPDHPAFKNLKQEDFDTWAGHDGLMFEFAVSPLDEGLVAVAPTGSWRDSDSVKSVLCDAKLGEGEVIFSQIAATKRVKTDSVAREYLRNLLRYFLTKGVQRYALELPEKDFSKVVFVEDKDAYPIELGKFVNRGFTDDKSGDRKGGWADFGNGFANIPTGTTRLQGGVPFKIIDPAENQGKSCLVLKGKKRDYFPEKVTGIPVNAKLNSIYFLHTAMYAKKGAVVKYVFHYADGQTREFVATNEHDIPDWWAAKDRSNAIVVFRDGKKGLYMSEFVNPLPKVDIKSMDIISCDGSIPIIIGITGRKRFTSVIPGVGEK